MRAPGSITAPAWTETPSPKTASGATLALGWIPDSNGTGGGANRAATSANAIDGLGTKIRAGKISSANPSGTKAAVAREVRRAGR